MKKILSLFVAVYATCMLWAGDVITYTANAKLTEVTVWNSSGLHTNAFNVPITSHTFSSGTGTITFADDVTRIGAWAFYNCSSITSINIPNTVTSIGFGAFQYCYDLSSFTIPNSVISIGEQAFVDCRNLSSIIIPNSVTSIGQCAFSSCSDLTSITIPNSVTSIGLGAFSRCNNLSSIIVEPGCIDYDSRDNCNAIIQTSTNTLIAGCKNTQIPNSITSIEYSAFDDCSSITSITIPESVTSIGAYAFRDCRKLIWINIPSSVTNIEYNAFERCTSLISITCEAATPPICGSNCFQNTSKSIPLYVPASSVMAYQTTAEWQDFINIQAIPNNIIVYTALTKLTETTSVSSAGLHTNAFNVSITSHTFSNGIGIITFSDDVTSIGDYAFYDCYRITLINFPKSVTSIGNYAFDRCSGLTNITIPNSVTSIGYGAFENSGLTSITIPNSITCISPNTFDACSHLSKIVWGNSIETIYSAAFTRCNALTSINIPNSITSIDYGAFGCPNVTSIIVESNNLIYDSRNNCNAIIETATNTLIVGCQNSVIANSVTSIGDYAFRDCRHLTSMMIPNSVISIGNYAFAYCSSLSSITCEKATPPTCGSYCFYYVDKSIPLYVPAGSVTAYQTAEGWRDFTNIQAIAPTRIEIPITAGKWHYIAFPIDVDGADIEYAGNGTWGYYNSTLRATGVSGWQSVDPEVTPLNANQGYIFYGDQDGTLYVNIDPATLPTGNKSISLSNYPSFHPDNANWNFVGNPYNATYNVRHIAPDGMNLYIWNGTGYYYKEAGRDSYDLQPLEAFFVQKKNTENSVNFAAASAGAAAPARVWAANSNRYIDIAAVAGGYTDYTRVVLNETASVDYTTGYDIAKFFSDEAPIQLFSLDAQSIECGVQELPNGVEEIALGYTVLESGEVVISTTDMEETYYLYDAETGITTDLRQSTYTFTAEAGTTVNRLSLRHAPMAPTDVEHVDGVNKYVNTPTKVVREGHVLILRGEKMYDLRGQEVK